MEDIARQLLVYGRRVPKAELFARIDAVDEETVKEVAGRFIYDQVGAWNRLAVTLSKPFIRLLRLGTVKLCRDCTLAATICCFPSCTYRLCYELAC